MAKLNICVGRPKQEGLVVVQQYEKHVLASDSENVERLRKAKNAAEKKCHRPGTSKKLKSISLCCQSAFFLVRTDFLLLCTSCTLWISSNGWIASRLPEQPTHYEVVCCEFWSIKGENILRSLERREFERNTGEEGTMEQ